MHELPIKFVERIHRQFPGEADTFLAAFENQVSASVLLNPYKYRPNDTVGKPLPWHPLGLELPARPRFAADPLWHAGVYYSQESSSMFLGHVLLQSGISPGGLFLDLCAAPGGKSLVISAVMCDDGLLVSNEMHPLRAAILKENIVKHGRANIAVTRNTPDELAHLGPIFEMVLVDAPCSGEGMFRRDPAARAEWNPGLPAMCAARQKDILQSAHLLLRPGGLMVYSTCTFAPDENEDILDFLENEWGYEAVAIDTPSGWPLQKVGRAFRFTPHISPGEGLFMAAIRKPGSEVPAQRKKASGTLARVKPPEMPFAPRGLSEPIFFSRPKQTEIFACSANHFDIINALDRTARVIGFPLEIGEIKGRDLVPAHHLAMASPPDFNPVNLDESAALDFLRKNEITLDAPKGWVLVGFKNRPLGWVKNLGNRSNNYYPKDYRLRT